MADQLDMFTDYDAKAAIDAWYHSPHTCPRCGEHEPNGYLLTNNHGIGPDGTICGYASGEHPNYGSMCVAQFCVSNHIWHDVTRGRDASRSIARGKALGLDVDAIVNRARDTVP